MTPTHDSMRDYYGAPIRVESFWICLLAQLNLFGFMCSPASQEALLYKSRPDIDTLLCISIGLECVGKKTAHFKKTFFGALNACAYLQLMK